MNPPLKADQQKPTFKIDDFNGLPREHLARVFDVMDMATYFEDMLNDEPVAVFDKKVKEYLEEHIHLEFDKKETAAIKEILAKCYQGVWSPEVHDHIHAINMLNMELCEKGDTEKAFKKLTKSYKKLRKFMAKGGMSWVLNMKSLKSITAKLL